MKGIASGCQLLGLSSQMVTEDQRSVSLDEEGGVQELKAGDFRAADSRAGPERRMQVPGPPAVHRGEMHKFALTIHFLDFSEYQT